MEEISEIKVALVSHMVVVSIMAVGMATIMLVTQEAILAMVKHCQIWQL
jgi:hypothetical protein